MSHTPTVTVAKNAGFCFGVARATKAVESEMANHPAGERIFTLGRLIHNEDYNRRLVADRKSTRLNSSHKSLSRMPSSA